MRKEKVICVLRSTSKINIKAIGTVSLRERERERERERRERERKSERVMNYLPDENFCF